MKSKSIIVMIAFFSIVIIFQSGDLYSLFDRNDIEEMDNFGMVIPNVYRGERIGDEYEYFNFLQSLGVTAIINLEANLDDDREMLYEYGFAYYEFPISLLPYTGADRDFDYYMLLDAYIQVVQLLENGEVIYIHCYHGSDRTGALAAAIYLYYNICGQDYDPDLIGNEIENRLSRYGFHDNLYPDLHTTILSWVYNPPPWICSE